MCRSVRERKVVKIRLAGRKEGSFQKTSVEEINVIGRTDPLFSWHEQSAILFACVFKNEGLRRDYILFIITWEQ